MQPSLFVPVLLFGFGFKEQRYQKAEKDRGGDPSCGGGDPAGEDAEKALFRHCLFNALRQQLAEAGQRDGGPGSAPVGDGFIQADTPQDDP